MKTSIQATKTWLNVRLSDGDFEQYSEGDFEAQVNRIVLAFRQARRDVIVNMTEVGFLPTIAIKHIGRLVQEVRGGGCHIAFLNLPDGIHSILATAERSRSPRKFASEKEAVKFVTQKLKKKEAPEKQLLVCLHS